MTTVPILTPSPAAIAHAVSLLRDGRLVALPTETVYGLAANARDDEAVARIFAAKARPRFNPLIVHCADTDMARSLVQWDDRAETLAHAFWPGPLTLVLPRRPGCPLSWLVSAGLDSVAIRVPDHPMMRAVLIESQLPLAAPSANRSGKISPTIADHVAQSFAQQPEDLPQPAAIIDGGACRVGIESTILDLTVTPAVILRAGIVLEEQIATLIGPVRRLQDQPTGQIKAPGQLLSHYAPDTPLRLDATSVDADEVLLGFGPTPPSGALAMENLSLTSDLTEAAANLFAMLHRLDRHHARHIAVMPVPSQGLGEAINDRLRRAAAPRDAKPLSASEK